MSRAGGPWSVEEGPRHTPASALSKASALRAHLDDSAAENGPPRVLPGTRNSGVLSDDEIHALAERVPAIDCLATSRGIVAIRPRIAHSSSKSVISASRRVLHIEDTASSGLTCGLALAIA